MPETIFAACEDIDISREQSACYDAEVSGLYGFAAVSPDATIASPSTPTIAELLAAEVAGLAFIVRKNDIGPGSYAPTNAPRVSAVEFGYLPAQNIGQDWTAVVEDRQGVGNEGRINDLLSRHDLNLYFFTADRVTHVLDTYNNISPVKVNPTGDTSVNHVAYTITFRTRNRLLTTSPFSQEVGGASLITYPSLAFDEIDATAPTTAVDSTVTGAADAVFTANVLITGATTYERKSGNLPTGLTGSATTSGYSITGTPTVAGTYTIVVAGTSPGGVVGTQTITIIITGA